MTALLSGVLRSATTCAGVLLLLSISVGAAEPSFAREVLPLLSDRCFKCHGPDDATRKAGLRLDRSSVVADAGATEGILVPGYPERSELFRRITADDADERMPPADAAVALSGDEIELLRRWIESGASWEEHWAFRPLRRPQVAEPVRRDWARNPIDQFILAELERQGLAPSPEADAIRLQRRVSLGLTGLPPTDGHQSGTYEASVERLLSSPAFGERVAQLWLDLARYADTSGYQNDGPRSMWRWRDWVIDAFNDNRSFSQFTREQLAGDLLPSPSLSQQIATGFNRNHRGNAEGGIVPEEYAVEYVVDRVETMGTVWLGLTVGCARCHDHKYDPISQKEFYQLYAFFNNIPEHGRAIKEGNSPPYVKAPTAAQSKHLQSLDQERVAARAALRELELSLNQARRLWERRGVFQADQTFPRLVGLQTQLRFDEASLEAALKSSVWQLRETKGVDEDEVDSVVNSRRLFESESAGAFGYFDRFTVAAWIQADDAGGTIWSRMMPTPRSSGYSLDLVGGRLHVNLVKRWLDDSIRVHSDPVIEPGRWHHVAVVYDGSRVAAGIQLFVDGNPIGLEVDLDGLNQSFAVKAPFAIGIGNSSFGGRVEDLRIYSRDLSSEEVGMLAVSQGIEELVAIDEQARSQAQADRIRNHFLADGAAPHFVAAVDRVRKANEAFRAAYDAIPTVMVMKERPDLRPAYVLARGRYDRPGERVERQVPDRLPPFPEDRPLDRLGLADWLTMPSHPLTARVLANRLWQLHFGSGLVRTPENFGIQGEPPTHPDLLDWLAVELVESDWNMKHLHRLIVSSATYRQSSEWTPELRERDPQNRWWARGPRFRLPAEWVRDRALAVSGLLTDRIGGPSVKPYQPEGLWREIASDTVYQVSEGEDLYRRSLYTYWKRTVSPPLLAAFDAPTREACVVLRSRTNTPLQALGLLNDTGYLEAAKALAFRVLTTDESSTEGRVRRAIEWALSRPAREAELSLLGASFQQHEERFSVDPDAAQALLNVGQSRYQDRFPKETFAALTLVCSTLMNLDEFVTLD